jgi:hypothetical protein
MVLPVKLRNVVRLLIAAALTAILFESWLTTPVLEHLTRNQWRGVAFGVMAVLGVLWSRAEWSLSTLVVGSMAGLLLGGTRVSLPISHGRIGDAFKSILESFGADMIAFILAATVSGYCVSRLTQSHGYSFGRRDEHSNGS